MASLHFAGDRNTTTKTTTATSNSNSSSSSSSNKKPTLWIFSFIVCCAFSGQVGFYIGLLSESNHYRLHDEDLTLSSYRNVMSNNATTTCLPCQQEQEPTQSHNNNGHDNNNNSNCYNFNNSFPKELAKTVVGMRRVPRHEFATQFDTGVPLQPNSDGNEQVLILYSDAASLMDQQQNVDNTGNHKKTTHTLIPYMENVQEATANCDFLNVILTNVDKEARTCIALVGQYESSHIQRFMRRRPISEGGEMDASLPLKFGGRFQRATPIPDLTKQHWKLLHEYFGEIDSILDELRPVAKQIARNNTLIVMMANHGQSELLLNFLCNAHYRNIDISGILVFATDVNTRDLMRAMNVTVYYHDQLFSRFPSQAAAQFADKTYGAMLTAKSFCFQLASMLGYDILFQDVDVIWYKDPLPFFQNKSLMNMDVMLAYDGNDQPAYLPYIGNTGFFYLRNNDRTKYLLNSVFLLSDSNQGNDQYLMNHLMAEHASWYGLTVKILDPKYFPTGVIFHRRHTTMKDIVTGVTRPYMFHMSWTSTKVEKVQHFEQMGEWFVQNKCIGANVTSIVASSGETVTDKELITNCCSMKPLITCHDQELPSDVFCKNQSTGGFWS